MRNWLIYEPPGGARRELEDVEKFVVVREGFSKAAFFLAPFWLAWRRCWLALGLWIAAVAFVFALFHVSGVEGGGAILLLTLPSLAVGFEAAWIRARTLESRGYTLAGSAVARTSEEAEVDFFQNWLAEAPAPEAPASAFVGAYQPARTGVLGLFPAPGATR